MYAQLIGLGLSFLQQFLGQIKNHAPVEVVTALQAAVDAVATHYADEITKANLEAQRG